MNISKISISEKPQFQELFAGYLTELNAEKDYPYLDLYWKEEKRIPLKYTENDIWLGFALINDYTIIKTNTISIAEFYILPEYRRNRIGFNFASSIFCNYQGNWEIRTDVNNLKAILFWENILIKCTKDFYSKTELNQSLIWSFKN